VASLNSLPENEYVFMKEPQMFTMNIFSPYEAAKRLSVESKSLIKTGERYLEFLKNLHLVDRDYEKAILKNYEDEYKKVDSYKNIMIKVIEKYTDQVKDKLLQQMLQQRNYIGQHMKEIDGKISEINEIINGVHQTVEQRLQQIMSNEQAYLHKQMQSYYNQVDIEESINRRRFNAQRFAQQQSSSQSHFQEAA
jgi:ABC-type Zn uptake system ZnuABC Zn-binding protein ZnuA